MTSTKKTISTIIDTEYKNYAMYVLESRALPSAIDGFKPVQRKLVYAMIEEFKGKKTKVADLGGISKFNYHHGEASAMGAAIKMAAPWSNNAPIFESHGAFGSRLIQESAAPRYIYASLSPIFNKVFTDKEIAPINEDLENPEPAHYLPIIPWALINGSEGIAVGYKHSVLPRSIKDVTKAVRSCLKDPVKFLNDSTPMLPTFPDFRGVVAHVEDNKYTTTGIVNYIGKYTFEISELPIGYDRASYVQVLADMEEKGLIKDFSDECSKAGFCFHVKVSLTAKEQIEKDPIKFFKLQKNHTEQWNLIDIRGKLIQFSGPRELVAYFVNYRITKCGDKIEWEIDNVKNKIKRLNWRKNFIQAIINKEVVPSGMKKLALEAWITVNIDDSDDARKLSALPLYACTTDEVEKLHADITQHYKELDVLMNTTPVERYESMLKSL